jgi:hypothetical protein
VPKSEMTGNMGVKFTENILRYRQNGQASNNRGHKPEKFVDYLLKTG